MFSADLLLDDKQALRNIFVEVGLGVPLVPRFVFLQVVFTGDSCEGTRLCSLYLSIVKVTPDRRSGWPNITLDLRPAC